VTRMKKGMAIGLAFIMMLVLIAGCSTGGNKGGSTTAPSDGGNGSGKTDEIVTLKYLDWAPDEERKSQQKSFDAFMEANPNIKIDYQSVPESEYVSKLTAMAASKTLPDISAMNEAQALRWAESGILMDMSEYYENGTISPKMESNKFVSPDGKLLGYSVANEIIILHYNKQIFDDAGLPYPPAVATEAWTWDEMLEVARKLTVDKNGKHPNEEGFDKSNIVQYGIDINHAADFFWTPFAISNGGGEVSQDGKELLINKPETIEAIQKIADLALKEYVSPTPAQAQGLPGDVGQKLASGKIAMATSGQWELVNIAPQLEKGLRNGVGVLPIFKKPATTNTGLPLVIYNTTKNAEAAITLYKWLMDPNQNQANFDSGVWMPTELSWYTDPELIAKWTRTPVHPPEYKTAVIDYALEYTYPTPWFFLPTYSRLGEVLNPGLDPVWLGEMTAQEAIDAIYPKMKEIFDSGKANP